MGWFRDLFSFLFTSKSAEERVAVYIVREHDRGRPLTEILDDPYIKGRVTEHDLARILERPEVVRALGMSTITAAATDLDGASSG